MTESYNSSYRRILRLRVHHQWSWKEVGEALDLSSAMLMMIKSGKRQMSVKSEMRLLQAERTAGLADQEDELLMSVRLGSQIQKASGEKLLDESITEGRHASERNEVIQQLTRRAVTAERKLEALRNKLRSALNEAADNPVPSASSSKVSPEESSVAAAVLPGVSHLRDESPASTQAGARKTYKSGSPRESSPRSKTQPPVPPKPENK